MAYSNVSALRRSRATISSCNSGAGVGDGGGGVGVQAAAMSVAMMISRPAVHRPDRSCVRVMPSSSGEVFGTTLCSRQNGCPKHGKPAKYSLQCTCRRDVWALPSLRLSCGAIPPEHWLGHQGLRNYLGGSVTRANEHVAPASVDQCDLGGAFALGVVVHAVRRWYPQQYGYRSLRCPDPRGWSWSVRRGRTCPSPHRPPPERAALVALPAGEGCLPSDPAAPERAARRRTPTVPGHRPGRTADYLPRFVISTRVIARSSMS